MKKWKKWKKIKNVEFCDSKGKGGGPAIIIDAHRGRKRGGKFFQKTF